MRQCTDSRWPCLRPSASEHDITEFPQTRARYHLRRGLMGSGGVDLERLSDGIAMIDDENQSRGVHGLKGEE